MKANSRPRIPRAAIKEPNSIPPAPGAMPILGHIIPVLRHPHEFLAALPSHGDLMQLHFGPVRVLAVCAPELVHQVMHNDRTWDKGGPFFDRLREILGIGVATCPHGEHRRQRRLLQPSFHQKHMPYYAELMAAAVTEVTDAWHDGDVIDVVGEMSTIAANSVTGALFSGSLTRQSSDRLIADVNTIMSGMYRRMLMPKLLRDLPTPGNRRYTAAHTSLQQEIGTIIADRRSADDSEHRDLLSAMLAARDHHDVLSGEEVSDNIVSFFMAGTATTASALAWALHHLASHPPIEQQLHTEVDSVLAGRSATYADLPRLQLTSRVLTETLRLAPPAWMLTRVATTDTELGGFPVPAGTMVLYSPYSIHHQENLHPDPERFDPDRWLPGRDSAPRNAFIPFGGGPRKCIGDAFATTEATLALADICHHWHLEHLPRTDVRIAKAIELRPRGLRMRTTARSNSRSENGF